MANPIVLFSWQIYSQLLKLGLLTGAAGSFVSPLSLYLALALVLNGAGPLSQTQKELWRALNQAQLPANTTASQLAAAEAVFNNQTAALIAGLLSQSSANGTTVGIANGIWTLRQPVLKLYADQMRQVYKAPVVAVNSTDPINAWTRDRTNGRIQKIIAKDAKFNVLVTNAVYFKGAWEYAFDPQDTLPQPFQTSSNGTNKTVQVPMMYRSFKPRDMTGDNPVVYANLPGYFRAIKLPYKSSEISAIAVLPDQKRYGLNVDAAALEFAEMRLLNNVSWQTMYNVGRLNLQMPKFTIKTDQIPLKQALRALNVSLAFNEEKADFSRMAQEQMYITNILQSTYIQVDESGTEAAAVTSVVMVTTAYNPDVEDLVFDRPFIFLIVDDSTDTILFQGVVKDPSRGN